MPRVSQSAQRSAPIGAGRSSGVALPISPREYSDLQWDIIMDFLKWRREEAALWYFEGREYDEDYRTSFERWLDEVGGEEEADRRMDEYWNRMAQDMATPH